MNVFGTCPISSWNLSELGCLYILCSTHTTFAGPGSIMFIKLAFYLWQDPYEICFNSCSFHSKAMMSCVFVQYMVFHISDIQSVLKSGPVWFFGPFLVGPNQNWSSDFIKSKEPDWNHPEPVLVHPRTRTGPVQTSPLKNRSFPMQSHENHASP